MTTDEKIEKLEARIAYLEKDALKRVPENVADSFILLSLFVWFFERNPDADFEHLASELMRSVDDMPVPNAPADAKARVQAKLSVALDEFLATARQKVATIRGAR